MNIVAKAASLWIYLSILLPSLSSMINLSNLPLRGVVRLLLITIVCGLVMAASEAGACPTCKDGVAAADPQSQSMAAGYFYSILFMMSMPFIILGTFGTFAYRSVVKARAQQERDTKAASP